MATSNVALRLAEAFARHGVTVTFGQSLPSAFHLAAPHVGIRQAAYRQENAGGAMADGYARISGRVSVVTAQNGPAATLLVAPLAEALKASIPIVALVQEVTRATTDKNAFQELDHLNMFAPVAKLVGYVMGRGSRSFGLRVMIERTDLVLLIGKRTNQNGTDSWKLFPPPATFAHLDNGSMEVGRNYEFVRLVGDAKLTLAALAAALRRCDLGVREVARAAIEAEIAAAVADWRSTVASVRSRDGGRCGRSV
jgi:thiamine pyrophosphate-dependent acetolactate synthase large subunit-like protein